MAELYRFLDEVVRQVASVGLAAEAIDRWRPITSDGSELPDRRPASRRAAWFGAAALQEPDYRSHLCCDDLAMVVLRSPPRPSSFSSTPDPLEVALQQGVLDKERR